MKKTWVSLLLALLLCALLAGCGKKGMETAVTKPARSKPAVPAATEEASPELPYQPGQMGVYVVTDPELEAAPEPPWPYEPIPDAQVATASSIL